MLRNSWGVHWGMGGHAKVVMFQNACNIGIIPIIHTYIMNYINLFALSFLAQQGAAYINH